MKRIEIRSYNMQERNKNKLMKRQKNMFHMQVFGRRVNIGEPLAWNAKKHILSYFTSRVIAYFLETFSVVCVWWQAQKILFSYVSVCQFVNVLCIWFAAGCLTVLLGTFRMPCTRGLMFLRAHAYLIVQPAGDLQCLRKGQRSPLASSLRQIEPLQ